MLLLLLYILILNLIYLSYLIFNSFCKYFNPNWYIFIDILYNFVNLSNLFNIEFFF